MGGKYPYICGGVRDPDDQGRVAFVRRVGADCIVCLRRGCWHTHSTRRDRFVCRVFMGARRGALGCKGDVFAGGGRAMGKVDSKAAVHVHDRCAQGRGQSDERGGMWL